MYSLLKDHGGQVEQTDMGQKMAVKTTMQEVFKLALCIGQFLKLVLPSLLPPATFMRCYSLCC